MVQCHHCKAMLFAYPQIHSKGWIKCRKCRTTQYYINEEPFGFAEECVNIDPDTKEYVIDRDPKPIGVII